jgi:spore coat protein JB
MAPCDGSQPEGAGCLLSKIQQVSFALTDLSLFLDTHPDCDSAICLYQQTMQQRIRLLEEFTKNYFPLNQDCIHESNCNQNQFCWTLGPAPWEGEEALCSITKKD